MRRIYRVDSKEFVFYLGDGYHTGDITQEMLDWINSHCHSYQMYALEYEYPTETKTIVEIIVYEEE